MTISSHILAAIDGPTLTPLERELILKHKVLGFTLFKRNIESLEQVQALNAEIKSLAKQAGYEIILAVDHEGGRVFRLPEPFTKIPAMRLWGNLFDQTADAALAFELGKTLGSEASLAGFNLDFAPVVDVDLNEINPIIGDRAFSKSTEAVYKMARQVIRGLNAAGVLTCLKHFPGHGATEKDSHEELPIDDRGVDELEKIDLVPYAKLISEGLVDSVMTAHVVYPKIDAANPATLSQKIITGILRDKLKYTGVIFSDDLLMKAIADNYGIYEAALQFFKAGGDAILVCKKPELTLEIIERFDKEKKLAGIDSHLAAAKARLNNLTARLTNQSNTSLDATKILAQNALWVQNKFPA